MISQNQYYALRETIRQLFGKANAEYLRVTIKYADQVVQETCNLDSVLPMLQTAFRQGPDYIEVELRDGDALVGKASKGIPEAGAASHTFAEPIAPAPMAATISCVDSNTLGMIKDMERRQEVQELKHQYERRIDGLEGIIEKKETKIDTLTKQLEEAKKEIEELEKENEKLEDTVNSREFIKDMSDMATDKLAPFVAAFIKDPEVKEGLKGLPGRRANASESDEFKDHPYADDCKAWVTCMRNLDKTVFDEYYEPVAFFYEKAEIYQKEGKIEEFKELVNSITKLLNKWPKIRLTNEP